MIKSLAPASACLHRSPKTFLIIFLFLSTLAGNSAFAATPDLALREKDVRRAERILAKLSDFEQAQSEVVDNGKRASRKIPGELFAEVASLRQSDLKTELTTLLFLYDELPGKELNSSYILAKARLHAHWARAMVNEHRGIKDGATISALEEMRSARRDDLRLCEEAVDALKTLENEVYEYSSLAEFEEHGRLARVSFEQLSLDVSRVLQKVDRVLDSLPRGPLFYPLYHARNAYSDGLFWWQKTHRRSEMVVNVNSFNAPDEMKASSIDHDTVNYTVAINWRKAIRHTREAARLIEALRTNQ
jgi:hypothetical protein